MAIEAGARAGMIAADERTFDYLKGRPFAPTGADVGARGRAVALVEAATTARSSTRRTSFDAADDRGRRSRGARRRRWSSASRIACPIPDRETDATRREGMERALSYMGLAAEHADDPHRIDKVFIGSCTNSRIEDLRQAAAVARGRRVAGSVKLAMVVPGSGLVKAQAEAEGLDRIFRDAGFEWREPGCSMCLAMNDDRLEPGERCASTSNRNFEGRQGNGGRTHLVSPAMAAAAAVAGHFVDVRRLS